jgi:ABC-type multidrug transport system fused ATPase/permease subunit
MNSRTGSRFKINLALRILSKRDQKKLLVVVGIQSLLNVLDLVGVAVIGLLGALSFTGIQSQNPGNKVSQVLKFIHISNESFQFQAAILGVLGAGVFLIRTVFSIFLTRKTLFFLSRRGSTLSSELIQKLMSQSLVQIQSRTINENIFILTSGVSNIVLGILGNLTIMIADVSLLFILGAGLMVVNPTLSFATFSYFAIIGYCMYLLMHRKAARFGEEESRLSIESYELITEALSTFRESLIRRRRGYYAREFAEVRHALANTLAEIAFLPTISKYVIEGSVILGGLLISVIQFLATDAKHAISTLAIFLAAGTRIAPAVIRIQQSSILVRKNLGSAEATFGLVSEIQTDSEIKWDESSFSTNYPGFNPGLSIRNLSFTYPKADKKTIADINLDIEPGAFVAIVGASGAGKSTLVDLLLGALKPESGEIKISNVPIIEAIEKWPGAISYVPQDVVLVNGSLLKNLTLGYKIEEVPLEAVHDAIDKAQLSSDIEKLPLGLNSNVGDRGSSLSGGQKQRLGIARGLLTRPMLLVLDEATSALDGSTEGKIANSINSIKGTTTIIMIAHRLSTVRDADLVIYMSAGQILAQGTFDDIRRSIPEFDAQARSMGL